MIHDPWKLCEKPKEKGDARSFFSIISGVRCELYHFGFTLLMVDLESGGLQSQDQYGRGKDRYSTLK